MAGYIGGGSRKYQNCEGLITYIFVNEQGAAKQQQRQQHAVRITVKAVSLAWGSVLTFWVAACSVHRVLFSGAARCAYACSPTDE